MSDTTSAEPLSPWVTMTFNTPLKFPEYSQWRCELFPGTVLRPFKAKEPNAFHRFMQRLCFGFKWSKTA